MKKEIRIQFVFIAIFFLFWIIGFIWICSQPTHEDKMQHINKIYGSIQFKGRVIKLHKIERGGRVGGVMCIKLDFANTDDFYNFDKISCFKIKNGIATFPTSSISSETLPEVNAILNAVYIEVNIDNNKQIVFIDEAGKRFTSVFFYEFYQRFLLLEEDFLLCDDC